MRWLIVGLLLGSIGCVQTQPSVVYKGITDPAMLVEQRPLPARPDNVPLTDAQNTNYPLAKGSVAPTYGILITPEKAARVLRLKSSYDELRALYEDDRKVFAQNRLIYEERLQEANAEISRLTPSWWDKHGFEVGLILGVVGAAGLTAGLYRLATATK